MGVWNGTFWNVLGPGAPPTIPVSRYSTLGLVEGGSTTPAGTALPAWGGTITLDPASATPQTWVRISGTDARVGDTIVVQWPGNRTTAPDNPARRDTAAASPGDPGTVVLPDGIIQLSLSSNNPDGAPYRWQIVGRKP